MDQFSSSLAVIGGLTMTVILALRRLHRRQRHATDAPGRAITVRRGTNGADN